MKLLKLDILNNPNIIFTNISFNTSYTQTIFTEQFIELLQVTF